MTPKNEKKGWFKKIADNEKYRNWVLVIGLIGIALIFISSLLGNDSKQAAKEAAPEISGITSDEYADALAQKLVAVIDAITGETGAQVMITMERGSELIYATEEKKSVQTGDNRTSEDRETSYIIVKNADGSQTALAVAEMDPVVKGVVVVCPRGDEIGIRQSITDALTTVLNISSARVCVLSSK